MKKIISILALITCLFMATPAQAQFRFGIKGGLNTSTVTFSDEVFKGDNRTGFFFGPTAEYTLPMLGLGLDVSALYTRSVTEYDRLESNGTRDSKETLKSLEFPINVKWTVGLGSSFGIFVAGGPQFGFNVGSGRYADAFRVKNCYKSFNLGGGIKLLRHIQLGINYNFGISKYAKAISQEYDGASGHMRKKMWQFSFGYMF